MLERTIEEELVDVLHELARTLPINYTYENAWLPQFIIDNILYELEQKDSPVRERVDGVNDFRHREITRIEQVPPAIKYESTFKERVSAAWQKFSNSVGEGYDNFGGEVYMGGDLFPVIFPIQDKPEETAEEETQEKKFPNLRESRVMAGEAIRHRKYLKDLEESLFDDFRVAVHLETSKEQDDYNKAVEEIVGSISAVIQNIYDVACWINTRAGKSRENALMYASGIKIIRRQMDRSLGFRFFTQHNAREKVNELLGDYVKKYGGHVGMDKLPEEILHIQSEIMAKYAELEKPWEFEGLYDSYSSKKVTHILGTT